MIISMYELQQENTYDFNGFCSNSSISFSLLQLHFRYQIEHAPLKGKGCFVNVFFGFEWLKSTRNQKRISKNINSNLQARLKLMTDEIEKEFLTGK